MRSNKQENFVLLRSKRTMDTSNINPFNDIHVDNIYLYFAYVHEGHSISELSRNVEAFSEVHSLCREFHIDTKSLANKMPVDVFRDLHIIDFPLFILTEKRFCLHNPGDIFISDYNEIIRRIDVDNDLVFDKGITPDIIMQINQKVHGNRYEEITKKYIHERHNVYFTSYNCTWRK